MAEDKLSKNELKRRMKADKKAAEKAEKAEKAKSEGDEKKPGASGSAKINEEEISPNEYFKLRSTAVEELKKDPTTHPYPHKFHVDTSLTAFIERYHSLPDGKTVEEATVRVAGRIHAIRESGAKLIFYDVRGEGKKLQIMANAKAYETEESFFHRHGQVTQGRHHRRRRTSGQNQKGRTVCDTSQAELAVAVPAHAASPPLRPQGQGDEVSAALSRPNSECRDGDAQVPCEGQDDILREEISRRPRFLGD